jgi:DNA-binding beta-propeller fold protein YncE
MRCEPNHEAQGPERNSGVPPKHTRKPKLVILAATWLAIFAVACGGGGSSTTNPTPPTASQWFFVESFSGQVEGFSAASGHLEPISGSSVSFVPASPSPPLTLLTSFAVAPTGMFLAVTASTAQGPATLEIANIASRGAISVTPLTAPVANAYRMAITSQGVIAISDGFSTIQFFTLQNNALLAGPAVQTGVSPQDLAFRADGKVLYALNAGSAIAVFLVAPDLSLQLIQDVPLPLAPGQLGGNAVRIRLNAAGNKIAATTLDGWVYAGDVNGTDGTVSGITEAQAAPNANLQEVVLDPTGQNVYTDDQDNGGIYEFSTAGGALTALPGSPVATPLGSMGMETDSTGTRLYLGTLGFPSSQIVTFSRDLSSGKLSATGDSAGTTALFPSRIVRVPAH